jgi:hypothetical protein
MVESLERAIKALCKLSDEDQEIMAKFILDEINGVYVPDTPTEPTMTLDEMIEEVERDIREGRTEPLDPDTL